jgi:DNA-binding response OmpR family regulator
MAKLILIVEDDHDLARLVAEILEAAGYVAKPITIDTLLDEVERICGLPEA